MAIRRCQRTAEPWGARGRLSRGWAGAWDAVWDRLWDRQPAVRLNVTIRVNVRWTF